MKHGLRLWINPRKSEYLTDVYMNNHMAHGVIISASYDANSVDMPDTVTVSPGSRAAIAINQQVSSYASSLFPQLYKLPCADGKQLKIINGTLGNALLTTSINGG